MKVREHLGAADAVWVVSNIRRAINDKTAREMMPTCFRQRLVDWGKPGALSFLATASYCLVSADPPFKLIQALFWSEDYILSL